MKCQWRRTDFSYAGQFDFEIFFFERTKQIGVER